MTTLDFKRIPRDDGWDRFESVIFRTDVTGKASVSSAVGDTYASDDELLGWDVKVEVNGHHYEHKLPSFMSAREARVWCGKWVGRLIDQQQTDLAEANRAAALLSGRKAP
jgi:hypothetical protein